MRYDAFLKKLGFKGLISNSYSVVFNWIENLPWKETKAYRVSQEEWTKLRKSVPYVKIYRYNPKHLYPKLNGYGDNGQRNLKV